MEKKLYIFGTSGFAREVADIGLLLGYDIKLIGLTPGVDEISGFEIISEDNVLNLDFQNSVFSIGVGEGELRHKIFSKFPNLNYLNLIHPSASMGTAQLDQINRQRGNIICAGVRFTNNIVVGDFGVYNLNVTVGHDCIIEDFVTISPGANVSGNVHIKQQSYIGTGSTILQGQSLENKLIINDSATVGAGAVVVKEVQAHTIVKGIPAK
ncbi:PglD-related sugar-binding protein [Lysinibacillus sp. G01H]|uniref:PglD-related sugar-binding protein n=1 Tax=Lysinibacillus sp. G01H TaxID=3026425 RepID=UPI00237E1FB8|nr:hypothetical protein [Lysinibacillus sp. G01H]WDU80204.1 hypothetical protein PSR12_03370 [Lysinibacillus sp. G01H]WHP39936.1 hypothetical protein QIX46_15250 [Lysinibacillus boronitolerans]